MKNKKITTNIDQSSYQLQLISVKYETLEEFDKNLKEESFQLSTKDSYSVSEIKDDRVMIKFKRQSYFEPRAIYDSVIEMGISYKINNKEKYDIGVIKDEIKEREEELLYPITAYISLIFGFLTSIQTRIPLIDPPFMVKDK